MPISHNAKSLFTQNIESSKTCLKLYKAIESLNPAGVDVSWVLRAGIVFAVSSLDAYFHDKIRYRSGTYKVNSLPKSLETFPITLSDIAVYQRYTKRPGNFVRQVLVKHFAVRPLQKKDDIAKALKIVEIENLWATIEPHSPNREKALKLLEDLISRRNGIAHEGDREHSRRSGKLVRPITEKELDEAIKLVTAFVYRIEHYFPN